MYLKALEIQGFKSFPDKTVLSFDENVTAIVGPNGSGKSNIADALRWVMGEQSTRTLRGGKMEDVIFGGTEKRKRQGFAQVSLTLDNSTRLFAREESEIMITRRYYRSGESEYYINRSLVRLRDVNELLMDTGLGQEGYSIISQGRVDEILSAKNVQRREIFEEAAGISRYRHRKEETERKLERTEENLQRVGDKIEELELQVEPLREQAEKARHYLAYQNELRVLEISRWMDQLEKMRIRNIKVLADFETITGQLTEARMQTDACYEKSEELGQQLRMMEAEGETLRNRAAELDAAAGERESELSVLYVRIQNNGENAARLRRELETQQDRADDLAEQMVQKQNRLEELKTALSACRQEVAEKKIWLNPEGEAAGAGPLWEKRRRQEKLIQTARRKLEDGKSREKAAEEEWLRCRMEENAVNSRVHMLAEMEKLYEGYSKAVKTVMAEAGRNALPGIHGPVAGLLRTPTEYTVAIETALGGAMQHLVVDTEEDGKEVFRYLKQKDSGRVTCLPLSAIRPGEFRETGLERAKGYVGIASRLISYDKKYDRIFSNLLGRVVIVRDLDSAIAMARGWGYRFRIVTLDGQVLNPGGSMTGGSVGNRAGILSRAGELETLRQKQTEAESARLAAGQALERARRESAAAAQEAEKAGEDLRKLEDAVREELRALLVKAAELETEEKVSGRALSELDGIRIKLTEDRDQQLEHISFFEAENEGLREEISRREALRENLRIKRRECGQAIAALSREKLNLEGERNRVDREGRTKNEELLNLQKEHAALEQKKMAASLEEEQILNKLWDTYQVTHEGAKAIRVAVDNSAGADRRIAELKGKIRALGGVNPGAIEEFQRVNERYTYLTEQRADVLEAKGQLEEIIGGITKEMREIFQREFQRINQAFTATFKELFGGGQAALELEDEEDVLNCGIEIRVQPPGKTLKIISLLSGGEKAFVAIALYFAILKVRPTPFCVMDEIEAALDEANVTRFAEYLRGMSGKTQFIVITHRRGTMEEADVLYGVTMAEQGISRLLRLNLNEAENTLIKPERE